MFYTRKVFILPCILFLLSCGHHKEKITSRSPGEITTKEKYTEETSEFRSFKNEKYAKFRKLIYKAFPDYIEYFGYYEESRVYIHDKILKSLLDDKKVKSHLRPEIIWTMGAYGSGKSYVLKKLSKFGVIGLDDYIVIDPDSIKYFLPEFSDLSRVFPREVGTFTHHESGYLATIFLEISLSMKKNIIIDGSLHDERWLNHQLDSIVERYPEYKTNLVDITIDRNTMLERIEGRNKLSSRKISKKMALKVQKEIINIRERIYKKFERVLVINNSKDIPIFNSLFYFGRKVNLLPKPLVLIEKNKNVLQEIMYKDNSPLLQRKKYTIVFDLDWTLFYTVPAHMREIPDVYFVDGVYYKLTDYAIDIISNLSKRENVEIAFFSGGNRIRNIELLKKVKLNENSGKSLFDLAQGRIFSFKDLTENDIVKEGNKEIRFWERFSKDISKVNNDIENILIVDDIAAFSLPDQEQNMAYLGKTYNYYDSWEEVSKVEQSENDFFNKFVPPNEKEFELERKKLVWMFGLIDESIEKAEHDKQSLVKAFRSLINDERGKKTSRGDIYNQQFFENGFLQLGLRNKVKNTKCSGILNSRILGRFDYFKR